jgi:hypothetical protein
MDRRIYYIDQFTDETIPCVPSLEGWAQWLALPEDHKDVAGWDRGPVADGAEFQVSGMEELADVEATFDRLDDDGKAIWTFSREPEADATFFAERHGTGLGWDAETSYDEWDGFLDYMVENAAIDVGQTMLVAVCRDLPPCRVRFVLGPTPALTIIGAVQ